MKNETRIEVLLEFGNICLRNDSVVQVHINPGVHLRYKEAQKLMETISGLSRYTSRPVVVDLRHIEQVDTAAKLYFLQEHPNNHNQCIAILISSTAGRMLANWSLLFRQTGCPIRYFNSETAALKWGQRFLPNMHPAWQTMAA